MFTNRATRRFCSRIFRQVKFQDVYNVTYILSELRIFIALYQRIFRFIQHINKIF